MKKAIVTGASGFIGTELCRVLNEQGVTTYAVLIDDQAYTDDLKRFNNIIPIICNMDAEKEYFDPFYDKEGLLTAIKEKMM